MGILRAIWAVIIGTVIAILIGVAFDYVRIVYKLETESLAMVYPWVSGVGGLFAGIAAVWVFSTGGRKAAKPAGQEPPVKREPKVKQPAKPEKLLAKAKGGSKIKDADDSGRVRVTESKEVPGMPTFELADDEGKSKPGKKETS